VFGSVPCPVNRPPKLSGTIQRASATAIAATRAGLVSGGRSTATAITASKPARQADTAAPSSAKALAAAPSSAAIQPGSPSRIVSNAPDIPSGTRFAGTAQRTASIPHSASQAASAPARPPAPP
jgi:hypothetical protein